MLKSLGTMRKAHGDPRQKEEPIKRTQVMCSFSKCVIQSSLGTRELRET